MRSIIRKFLSLSLAVVIAAAPLTALIATGMYLQKPKPAELRAG